MAVTELQIQRFRCLDSVTIQPHPQENLISGHNASGKTSLLEALFFLGHGRSFRGTTLRGLVQDEQEDSLLVAKVSDPDGRVGIQIQGGSLTVKIDGVRASSRSSLVARVPVQVIEPGIHKLIEEGPDQRRKYLDWGVFHVEHAFYAAWKRYRKALDQRNTALRERLGGKELAVWEDTLVASGEEVESLRSQYLGKLAPYLDTAGEQLFGAPLECRYSRGWSDGSSLAEAMQENREKDRRLFRTHAGPHRADLRVRLNRKLARARVSRGQQKLLAAGLVLAQVALFAKEREKPAVLLIDDPAAELDANSLEKLLNYARTVPAQRFITALDSSLIPPCEDSTLFHVEHGKVEKVV